LRSTEKRGRKVIQYYKTVRARDRYDDTKLNLRQKSRTTKTYSSTASKNKMTRGIHRNWTTLKQKQRNKRAYSSTIVKGRDRGRKISRNPSYFQAVDRARGCARSRAW